jgi:signal transduction histidine kinase
MIVAPIQVEDKKFGVLDIRGTGKRHFPRQAETIAELLGQQLGLYGYLAAIIGQLRKVIETVNRLQEQQILTLEDFEHQLKSPINQAYLRVQMALKDVELLRDGSKLEYDLLAIRGLFRKIKRVTTSTGLFAEIANKKPILPKHSAIQYDSLIKLLIEAANDSLLMVEPRRRIKFNVDRKSFDSLRSIKVEADLELLEQAIMNILDNAAKYSFPETNVQIYGGLTKTRRFHISIANKGLPIRPHEVRLCFQRGWRSEHAQVTTGEGSGIGLWIVDHIMKAHEGELIVVPTTSDGITEVKLVFPSIER